MSSTTSFGRPLFLLRGGTRPDAVAATVTALRERIDAGGRGAGPQPLLVPIGPGEDEVTVASDLSRRLDPAGPAAAPDVDVLLRTSGSTTGTGALVAMSMSALTASARATHARLGGGGTWVLALPAHHIAGLQVLVRSILAGTAPVIVDTSGGFDPGALADGLECALNADHGPVRVSLVPIQLMRALAPGQERAAAALARADAVLLGGAAVDPALLERARAAGVRVVTTYGMSETGGGCVYDGVPLDGVKARIENPDADGVGRIVLSGTVLARGYADDATGHTAVFRDRRVRGAAAESGEVARGSGDAGGRPSTVAGRELLTGDLGRVMTGPDGIRRLAVLGRVDDVIITGGIKVAPREVEQVLTVLPGVGQACVVGLPHAQWGCAVAAVVVPEMGGDVGDPRAWARRLRAEARERLDGAHTPKRILIVEALPLRGPGKVDRRAVARLAEEAGGLAQDSE
ncbi:AMP-binding protein [Actinomyces sp.]|uniref:AMP-binding protein n=1 Tax=Actinomyces sp. TaxID=29317 RepID=UPI0026DC4FDD|nr:AMP-binding protein [Actinomyces sp.]MDO4899236.1 AMP-binding protein [Actinomyces sp.]